MTTTDVTAQPTQQRPRRTRLAGVCLLLGAALLVLTGVLDPEVTSSGEDGVLASMAAAPGQWTAWALALTATGLVLLPAVAALGAAVTGRGAGLTVTGAVMTGAGTVGMTLVGTGDLDLVTLVGGGLTPEASAAAAALESSPGLAVAFVLLLLGWYVGRQLLLWGLWRARRVALWVPVTGTVAALGSWFGSEWPNPWEGVSHAVAAVALVGCAPVLLRRRPEPQR